MYTILKTRREISTIENGLYKLCYIGEIPQEILDDTPETKAFKETDEYRALEKQHKEEMDRCLKETGRYVVNITDYFYSRLHSCYYPNPEYVPGKYTHYAYFTPRDLKDQWGDDWDDTPYEHGEKIPYDDGMVIIQIPFYLPDSSRLPCTGYDNSHYSVEEINMRAVAWIFDKEKGFSIQAGISPQEFIDLIWDEED